MNSDILLLTDDDTDIFKMMDEENNYMDLESSASPPPPPPLSPTHLENSSHPSPIHSIPTHITEPRCRPLIHSKECSPSSSFSKPYYSNRWYPPSNNIFHPNQTRRPFSHRSFRQTHNFMIASTTEKGYTLTSNSVWRSRFQHFGRTEWTNDVLNFMKYHPVEIIYVPNHITQRRVMEVIENSVPVCLIPVPPHILGDSRKMASYIAYLLNKSAIYHRRTPYRASMRYTHYTSPLNRRYFKI